MTLQQLSVNITANTQQLMQQLNNATSKVNKFGKDITKSVNNITKQFSGMAKAFIGYEIAKVFGNSVQDAMKVEGAIQQIQRTMGQSSNSFLKWAKDNALAFNMSQSDAMKFGATFSNLVMGFSKDTTQVATYTEDLLKASSIVASGTGRSMEDVMERIRSGLLGNTESIEDLGINVNVAMLESTKAFQQFANGKSWEQLSFQTQQQIRMFAILEQTTNKFGTTVANNTNSKMQQFVAVLKDIALNIGNAFLPLLNVVLPILTNFAMGLRNVTATIASFMSALFGKANPLDVLGKGTGNVDNASTSLQGYGNSLGNVANSAKKASKDINRLIGGFDELNVLSKDKPSEDVGDSGLGVTPTPTPPIQPQVDDSLLSPQLQALADKIKGFFSDAFGGISQWWHSIDFEPLKNSFDRLKESISPIIGTMGENLKWFIDEILAPLGKWAIEDGIPAFFNLLSGALDVLNPILEAFQRVGKWLWDEFLQPIAEWTGGVIVDVLNGLGDQLTKIGDWMDNHKEIMDGIAIVLTSIAIALGLVSLATTIWTAISWIATYGTTALGVAFLSINWPLVLIVGAIAAVIAIGLLLYKHWDEVVAWAKEKWEMVKVIFQVFVDWLKDVFSTDWSKQFGFFGDILNGFLATIKDIWDGIKRIFNGIIDFVVGVFTGDWEKAWNGVKDIFGGIFDTFAGIAKAPINAVISLINGAIDALNKFTVKIPNWSILPDDIQGKSFDLNISKIPYLAKGGIVDSPTVAMVGEAGTEAIVPLKNNTGGLDLLADRLLERMPSDNGNSSNNNSPSIVNIEIEKVALARLVLEGIQEIQTMQGTSVLSI